MMSKRSLKLLRASSCPSSDLQMFCCLIHSRLPLLFPFASFMAILVGRGVVLALALLVVPQSHRRHPSPSFLGSFSPPRVPQSFFVFLGDFRLGSFGPFLVLPLQLCLRFPVYLPILHLPSTVFLLLSTASLVLSLRAQFLLPLDWIV